MLAACTFLLVLELLLPLLATVAQDYFQRQNRRTSYTQIAPSLFSNLRPICLHPLMASVLC
jgi:hypothetical protein